MGMYFSFAGFDLLIEALIAGVILRSDFEFSRLEAFSGVTTVAGFVFFSLAFFMHRLKTKSRYYSEHKRNNINAVYRVRETSEIVRERR